MTSVGTLPTAPPFAAFRLPVFEFLAMEAFSGVNEYEVRAAAAKAMPTARALGLVETDDTNDVAVSELLADAASLVFRPTFRVSIETSGNMAASVFYGFRGRLASRTLVVTDDEGAEAVCEVTLVPAAIADDWIRNRVSRTSGDADSHRLVLTTLARGERELWWSGPRAALIEGSIVHYLDGTASLQGALDSALAGAVQAAI